MPTKPSRSAKRWRDSAVNGSALPTARGARHLACGTVTHERSLLYRHADPQVRSLLPEVIATRADDDTKTWAVLLEQIRSPLMNAVDRPERWIPHVDTVIDGLTRLHWSWMGQVACLRDRPWMDRVRTTADVVQMAPLWIAMADMLQPMFASWGLSSLSALTRRLIDRAATWRPRAEALPQTLIHNDFNPRNICLRRRGSHLTLCAFDWELATIGAPTRDLAEFLCFVAADCTADESAPGSIVIAGRSAISRAQRSTGGLERGVRRGAVRVPDRPSRCLRSGSQGQAANIPSESAADVDEDLSR